MSVVGGIKYSDPLDFGQNGPYNGVDILADRKGGWLVRHRLHPKWIEAVPTRLLAGQIHEALCAMEISAKEESAKNP